MSAGCAPTATVAVTWFRFLSTLEMVPPALLTTHTHSKVERTPYGEKPTDAAPTVVTFVARWRALAVEELVELIASEVVWRAPALSLGTAPT